MPKYRFYPFSNENNREHGVDFEAASDEEAHDEAERLRAKFGCRIFELWRGKRLSAVPANRAVHFRSCDSRLMSTNGENSRRGSGPRSLTHSGHPRALQDCCAAQYPLQADAS